MPACIVRTCKNNSDISVLGISYHTFSKQLWKEWLRALKLLPHEVYKNSIICSEHFKPSDFITWNRYKTYRRLQRYAIPSLNLNDKENMNIEKSDKDPEYIEIKQEPFDDNNVDETNINDNIAICDKENNLLDIDRLLCVDKFEAEETVIDNINKKDAAHPDYKIDTNEFVNSLIKKHIKEESKDKHDVTINNLPFINDAQKLNESVDSNYVDIPDAIMIEGEIPGKNFKTGIDSNNFRIVNINKLLKNPINLDSEKTDMNKKPVNKQALINSISTISNRLNKNLGNVSNKCCGNVGKKHFDDKAIIDLPGSGTSIAKKRKIVSSKVEDKPPDSRNVYGGENKNKMVNLDRLQPKDFNVMNEKIVFPEVVHIEEFNSTQNPKLSQYKGVQMHNKKLKTEVTKLGHKVNATKKFSEHKSPAASVSRRRNSDSLPGDNYQIQTNMFKKLLKKHAKTCENDNFESTVDLPELNNTFLSDKSALKLALFQMAKSLDKVSEPSSNEAHNKSKPPKQINSNKNNIKVTNPEINCNEIWQKPSRKRVSTGTTLGLQSSNHQAESSNPQNLREDNLKQMEILKEIAIHHNYCLNPENLASEIQGLKQRLKVKENMYKIVTDIQTQLVGEVKDLNNALGILEAKYDEWIDCFL